MKNEGEKKGIKLDKKKIIIAIIAIVVIAAIIVAVVFMNKKANEPLYTTLEDGTRVNTSDKIVKTRTVDAFEMTGFEIQEKDDFSTLFADVKNTSEEAKDEVNFEIDVKDKDGNIIITMRGYVFHVGPGETARMSASATCDFSEAADLDIRLASPEEEMIENVEMQPEDGEAETGDVQA